MLTAGSLFFPDGNVVGVRHGNKIQQPGDNHEFCSVIRNRKGDRSLAAVHGEGRDIHSACTQVADEPENIENVAALGL